MHTLIKAKEFYQTLDLIVTPVILSDEKQRHLYFNKSFNTQIGYTLGEIRNISDWFEKAYPDPVYRQEVMQIWSEKLAGQKAQNLPYVNMIAHIYCTDKTYKWYDVYEYTINDIRVVTFLDVGELQERNEVLLDVIQQNNNLIAVLAHDIRNPLTTLQSIIKTSATIPFSPEQLRYVFSELDQQINRIFSIIDATLVHKSSELNRFHFEKQAIPVLSFSSRLRDYFTAELLKKKILFSIDIPENATLEYDTFILEIIMRNILGNAIKYCPSGGSIDIGFLEQPQYWNILVRDSGPGMSEEQIKNILHDKSARKTRNEIRNGFGLGLLIAKDMLERHAGRLSIESQPGLGCAFTICISRHPPVNFQ